MLSKPHILKFYQQQKIYAFRVVLCHPKEKYQHAARLSHGSLMYQDIGENGKKVVRIL